MNAEDRSKKIKGYLVFAAVMAVALGMGIISLKALSQYKTEVPKPIPASYTAKIRPNTSPDPTLRNIDAWPNPFARGIDQSKRAIPREIEVQVELEAVSPTGDTVVMVTYKGSKLWFSKTELVLPAAPR